MENTNDSAFSIFYFLVKNIASGDKIIETKIEKILLCVVQRNCVSSFAKAFKAKSKFSWILIH